MKKKINTNTILIIILAVGLLILLYPSLSNYLNERNASMVVSGYKENVSQLNNEEYEKLIEEAREYNKRLLNRDMRFALSDEELQEYLTQLSFTNSSAMGYVDIPSLNIVLPIYHTTSEDVLVSGVGHVEWSSLPVGGESTHSILSGHRGLPSAKLFTDIDKLNEGDIFKIHILNETLVYKVDDISIILPEDLNVLKIEEGKDYCTLVTCTPYGINTHRLLVRGYRVEDVEDVYVSSDAVKVNKIYVALFIVTIEIVIIAIYETFKKRKHEKIN